MRKVNFKKWIPVELVPTGKTYPYPEQLRAEGTGCYSSEFTESGFFHQWITSSEEGTVGVIIYPIALVEMSNGEILELPTNAVRFVDTTSFF